jgi:hypothetical protein
LALAAAACSDPPPTPAATGFTLNLTQPRSSEVTDLGSRACSAGDSGSHTYSVGQPAAHKTIEDGKNGVVVDCTVRGDGSFFATVNGYDNIGKERLSLSVSGRITDKASATANTGSLSFYTPSTLALETHAPYPLCKFGPVQTLKKGAVLMDVECPVIVGTSESSSGCRVDGTIAFEYCKTGEEED